MAPSAPTGSSTVALTLPRPPASDALLADLRRGGWESPVAGARALLAAAAAALAADTLEAWLDDVGGAPVVVRHPEPTGDASAPPDRAALAAPGTDVIEGRAGDALVLDVGLWSGGALAGALRVRRPAAAGPWTPADRALVAGIADRLALEGAVGARRSAERALRDRGQQMDLVEQIAGLGSWEIDLTTDAVLWSREQRRIHGLDAGPAPRTHVEFMRLVHPDDRRVVDDGMARLAGDEPLTVEFRVVRPDGAVRLLQARARMVPDARGAFTRVLGTSLDVTERRATEAALRANEESYRTIFEHASDAMWLLDLHTGEFLAANRAACEMYGYTAEEQRAVGIAG
jgi:PAS domain S-box-containing protein